MGLNPNGSRTSRPLPHGPHRLSAEQVACHQRERLIDAMVQLAGTHGFLATPVTDLIEHARVSRKTFYAHFANREDLLLAAFQACSSAILEEVRLATETPDASTSQLERLITQLCRCGDECPGAIAICSVEITAMPTDGLRLREELMMRYASLIQASLTADGEVPPSNAFACAVATALHRTLEANLKAEEPTDLSAFAAELTRWVSSYNPFPSSLESDLDRPIKPWPGLGPTGLVGGRAPGTLTLEPEGYLRRRGQSPTGFEAHTNRERILDALAQLNAEQGYVALTAEGIAARAELPLGAFRAQFKGKDDAFAAAVELGHMKGQAILERARRGAPSWAAGARNASYALLEFLASEPQFTKLALLDALVASSSIASRANEHLASYARVIFDGATQRRGAVTQVVPRACLHALFETAYPDASQGRLPGSLLTRSTYLVLAPFVGVKEAAAMSKSGNQS
jgi:AcrR family transcriptional regulator